MKKLLFSTITFAVVLTAVAQLYLPSKERIHQPFKMDKNRAFKDPGELISPKTVHGRDLMTAPDETTIGTTWYDLQSNGSLSGRIAFHPDGTIGAVWTYGMQQSMFPDRGTGYNFFNGSYWGPHPTSRIENIKTGWPSYDTWGPSGEILVAHNGETGLEISKRSVRGSGNWTQFLFQGPPGIEDDPVWPRLVTSGPTHEYVHLVCNSYNLYQGQYGAMLYSRSNDGGQSWDPHNIILPGTDSAYYSEIGTDAYTMAANGNIVAILCASSYHDMFVLKSADNGDTWNKTVIWEHPYPFFDGFTTVTDTFFCVDNSASVAVGPDGKVHVVFGITRLLNDQPGNGLTYFPYVDGIGYWNEDMATFSNHINALAPPSLGYMNSELVTDTNYVGWSQDVDGDGSLTFVGVTSYLQKGLSTMPSICVDDLYRVFIAYASTTETFANSTSNYKKIWMRGMDGSGWGSFVNVTNDIVHIFDETVYPVLSQTTGNYDLHLLYQADVYPGIAVLGDQYYAENNIIHSSIPKTDLVSAVPFYSVSTFPNPSSGGITSGDGIYSMGSTATISAVSNSNWNFLQWTENGNVVSTDSVYSFIVNNNHNFSADFILVNGTISTNAAPPEGGTTSGDGTYSVGDSATVSALANLDYAFDKWEENGVIVSTDTVFTFVVTGDHSLTAHFHYLYYEVTTAAEPVQGGTTSGDGTYLEGDTITISASTNPNWFFENWTENDSVISTDSIYTFEIDSNRNFVANYSGTEYSITTSAEPPEAGYTTGNGFYNYGFTATVSAFTNLNWSFANWTENDTIVSSVPIYSFEVTRVRVLQANFFRDTCEIITDANPPEGGATAGDGIFIQGDMVILMADPNDNFNFISWTENDSTVSTNMEYVFFADHSCLLTANFSLNTSIGQPHKHEFKIFPNPAHDDVYIEMNEHIFPNIDEIQLVSLQGLTVYKVPEINNNLIHIKIGDLGSGLYLIYFISENRVRFVQKIVILH